MTFKELNFKDTKSNNGIHAIVKFENNYGASVVKHDHSYGGKDGLYELAIFKDDEICYDTPITNDVLGYLSDKDVTEVLIKIQQL